ncbi:transglutaminase domain-containing protein [Thalassobaculum sp. OXR-137]|uniref:transglutaminase domain-containing protein n=1 Tax=Thalassobaculum sp. OXR-137 TaxID=3100173 RepID=UPI002AC923D4|nr:transglutaminase domain-containing protein [Thalassobaculum sp. OXR-137]WPZ36104.1 transglutaminase domain-containing protein [Thalassobaculum sp. OXR-137]
MSHTTQTAWSDPGPYTGSLAALPAEPVALADALENVLIHVGVAYAEGLGVPEAAKADANARTLSRLLEIALSRDPRPLTERREPAHLLYGTCHDFALFAAGVLRKAGVETRIRVGFADYFSDGFWDDHWICEYRRGGDWKLFDPELGPRMRHRFGISFNPTDLPRRRFMTGAQAWRAARAGTLDPSTVGVSAIGISGTWFAAGSLLRDAAAVAGLELLPWDSWGPAAQAVRDRHVAEENLAWFDSVAAAFAHPPSTRAAAYALLSGFPGALPGATVLSVVDDRLAEQPVL